MSELVIRAVLGVPAFLAPLVLVSSWMGEAEERLNAADATKKEKVAIASVKEDAYCTPKLKSIVRRVATACGLIERQAWLPTDAAKQIAQLSDEDFNALFLPLRQRARIIQFDANEVELDDNGQKVVEEAWGNQGGASFFFVVARASPRWENRREPEIERRSSG